MSFFNSEIVRAEMAEIAELQEEVYHKVFRFPVMTKEEKIKHVELLSRLLDKQKILYTRLSLSDDIEAQEMKKNISEAAISMGLPPNIDVNIVFSNMSNILNAMKEEIDKM